MRREHREIWAPSIGASGSVVVYGHWGRPVLAFPTEAGRAWDYEDRGMVGAVGDLVEAGRVKLYCVDAFDAATWSDRTIPLEERARRHASYEAWIVDEVVPWIHHDCGGPTDIITTGCSLGAFHALNFACRRADLFPTALCFSGNYDPSHWHAWGERGDAAYFNNPMDYLANLDGDHREWLRSRLSLLLVVGRGAWEVHPTQSLPSTEALAAALRAQGLRHELDVWGEDTPHDWSAWQRQLAYHLPRFC